MARTFNGLFERIITFESLYRAYLSARKGKRKSWPCRVFEVDLEGNLIELQNDLIWNQYQVGPYRSFYVSEPKRRKITALQLFRDRIVQHAIFREIEPIWEARFITHSYACRISKGTHKGADAAQLMMRDCLKHYGRIHVLKGDIRHYFASVNHEALKRLIRKRIGDQRLLVVIDTIIDSYSEAGTPGTGIPIGNLTSQLFANLYLDAFDQWMKCRRRERWYIRYMDDFVVIHPDKQHLHALRIEAQFWLANELALETNHKTIVFPVAHHQGRGLDFLGYHLWPYARRLRKNSLKRFKRRLRQWQKEFARGDIDMPEICEQLHSWVNHARHGHALSAINKALHNTTFTRGPDYEPAKRSARRNRARRNT